MKFVKKWWGCITSLVVGGLGLLLSLCSGMIVNSKVDSTLIGGKLAEESQTTAAYKIITDGDLATQAKHMDINGQFTALRVFAIITMIIAILLIIYGIVKLLNNLNVIKKGHRIFDIVGLALLGVMLIATIGLMITSGVYADAVRTAASRSITANIPAAAITLVSFSVKAYIGVYQYLILIISAIAVISDAVMFWLNKKH